MSVVVSGEVAVLKKKIRKEEKGIFLCDTHLQIHFNSA